MPGSTFTDKQIAEYNARHIEPFNPIIGQDCRSVNEEGIVSICNSIHERPPHPYKNLPSEELEQLAYNDPLAALYLALRTDVPTHAPESHQTQRRRKQRELFLRAAAISGKSGPLIKYAEWRLNSGRLMTPTQSGLQISYDLESVATKAAILTIAAEMGDDRAQPQLAADQLVKIIEDELPQEDVDHWLTHIQTQTATMRETMRNVKLELGL